MSLALNATARTAMKKKAALLRAEGLVPAVLYGHGIANTFLSVPIVPATKALKQAGESTLIDLSVDKNTPVKVLIHDLQQNPLTGDLTHIDFYQVNMKEELELEITLNFVGESAAVKTLAGTLVKSMDALEVKCLPSALVHEIDVDISVLATFDDEIKVKDIKLPAGVVAMSDPEETVAVVSAPISEEEYAKLNEDVVEDVSQVEVVTDKKEGEEESAA